jgi:DNA (cytosine-5)-methyltransferase 1
MRELALFAGAGGGILGAHLLGWRTVCAVEVDPFCREVLLRRQQYGCLPWFPIWDDICTFDGRPWRGCVDVVTGGFPCQDISAAGRGRGIEGQRSGLWREMARVISEVRPRYALVENSPLLVSRGLDVVLADLAALGYDARWGVIGARHAGAPHKRDRIWVLANAQRQPIWQQSWRRSGKSGAGTSEPRNDGAAQSVAHADSQRAKRSQPAYGQRSGAEQDGSFAWWAADPAEVAYSQVPNDQNYSGRPAEMQPGGKSGADTAGQTQSRLGRVAHGVAHRVDRLKAIGNGQVPAVVRLAWEVLTDELPP